MKNDSKHTQTNQPESKPEQEKKKTAVTADEIDKMQVNFNLVSL